jgi:hypothetical protein
VTKNLGIFDAFISGLKLGFEGALTNSIFFVCFPKNGAAPHDKYMTTNGMRFFNGNVADVDGQF